MFEINDYVIYGNKGVCKIDSIGTLDMNGIDKERLYYTLSYIFEKKGQLFSPVDSTKVIMRHVIKREAIADLIKTIPSIPPLLSLTAKAHESIYKDALRTCDIQKMIQLIKTIYPRQQYRISQAKKINQVEERYLRSAEEFLYGEIAIVMHTEKEAVPSYFMEQLGFNSLQDLWTSSL